MAIAVPVTSSSVNITTPPMESTIRRMLPTCLAKPAAKSFSVSVEVSQLQLANHSSMVSRRSRRSPDRRFAPCTSPPCPYHRTDSPRGISSGTSTGGVGLGHLPVVDRADVELPSARPDGPLKRDSVSTFHSKRSAVTRPDNSASRSSRKSCHWSSGIANSEDGAVSVGVDGELGEEVLGFLIDATEPGGVGGFGDVVDLTHALLVRSGNGMIKETLFRPPNIAPPPPRPCSGRCRWSPRDRKERGLPRSIPRSGEDQVFLRFRLRRTRSAAS